MRGVGSTAIEWEVNTPNGRGSQSACAQRAARRWIGRRGQASPEQPRDSRKSDRSASCQLSRELSKIRQLPLALPPSASISPQGAASQPPPRPIAGSLLSREGSPAERGL